MAALQDWREPASPPLRPVHLTLPPVFAALHEKPSMARPLQVLSETNSVVF